MIATIPFLIRRIASVSVPEADAEAHYAADIHAAFSIWNENDNRIHDSPNVANEMAALLTRYIPAKKQVDRRGFDWHYLWRLCHPAEAVGTLPQIASWQGHKGDAYFVTFSRDGSRLASAGRDGTARVWDGMTGHPICVCSGHSGDVNCVDFSPDGELLATASEDHTVKVWDARTGKEKFTLVGHAAEVVAAVFTPTVRRLFPAITWGSSSNGIWRQNARSDPSQHMPVALIRCSWRLMATCCFQPGAMIAFVSGPCRNYNSGEPKRQLRHNPQRSARTER